MQRSLRWCLATLATDSTHADRDAAVLAVTARVDPLLRSIVRARLSEVLFEAQRAALSASWAEEAPTVPVSDNPIESDSTQLSDPQPMHAWARFAYLEQSGTYVDPTHSDVVHRAFEAAIRRAPPPPPSRYGLTGILATFLLLIAATWTFVALAPDYLLDSRLEAPRTDAYRVGGRPDPGDEDQYLFFTEIWPRFILSLDRMRRGVTGPPFPERRAEALAAVVMVSRIAETRFGKPLGDAIAKLGEAAIECVLPEAEIAADGARVFDAAKQVNALLSQAGLGYQLDASVIVAGKPTERRVLIAAFRVEWVDIYSSGEHRVHSQRWLRADSMSFDRALLGFSSAEREVAVVLMDRVDAWLVERLLPALAPDAPLQLVDADARAKAEAWVGELEMKAGQQAREQVGALVGDRGLLERLGQTIVGRAQLIDRWNVLLRKRGLTVRAPEAYAVDLDRYSNLEPMAPAQWLRFVYLQGELESDELSETHRALRDALGRSVERHEVQHRLDDQMGTLAASVTPLAAYISPVTTRHKAELSAYLAELARGVEVTKVNLASLSRHIFDATAWGTAECYAALVILRGLSTLLRDDLENGVPWLVQNGQIDRREAARLFVALVEFPSDSLARGAALMWRDLFGRGLPELTVVSDDG